MRSAVSLVLLALVVLTLAGTWAVHRLAATRGAEATAAYPPEGEFIEVDGRRVHYVMRGTGPDVVLIHGASGNSRDMTFRLMGLLEGRYRVTAFDRPGLGYTDRVSEAFESAFVKRGEIPAEQAAFLRAAATGLGIERPIVVGHSYGAAVALAWALDAPEETAAVVDLAGAAMPWPDPLGTWYRATESRLGGAILPTLIAAFAPQRLVAEAVERTFTPDAEPPGYAAHLGPALSIRGPSFRANARQVNSLRPAVVEMAERYGSLTMPVEIVHGDADTIVPAAIHSIPLSRLIPGATLTILPGVGHMPHHSNPDAVVAAIDRAHARAER